MDLEELRKQLNERDFLVGLREAKRALEDGRARALIVASDADRKLRAEMERLCRQKQVSHHSAFTMRELGEVCGIDVAASVVTLL